MEHELDVFMIRLADNWKEQILPHAWPGLVSRSSLWLKHFLLWKLQSQVFQSLYGKQLKEQQGVHFLNKYLHLESLLCHRSW